MWDGTTELTERVKKKKTVRMGRSSVQNLKRKKAATLLGGKMGLREIIPGRGYNEVFGQTKLTPKAIIGNWLSSKRDTKISNPIQGRF